MSVLEKPLILANNLFKDPSYLAASSENPDYPVTNLLDMTRHTLWKSVASGSQNITVYMKNLVRNPGAELNLNYWYATGVAGSPTFTFTRNTTTPLFGNADFMLDKTAGAEDGSEDVAVLSLQSFRLKAGRTYYLTITFLGSATQDIKFGLLNSSLATFTDDGHDSYTTKQVTTSNTCWTFMFTPIVDYSGIRLFIEISPNFTLNFDNVRFGEYRDPDTLVIDRGHNLQGMKAYIQYATAEDGAETWSDPSGNSLVITSNDVQLLKMATPPTGNTPFWRVHIENILLAAGTNPQIANIALGQGWTLEDWESGQFDPWARTLETTDIETYVGVRRRFNNYTQRNLKTSFVNITQAMRNNIEKFFEDTRDGLDPWWWAWRPTAYPDVVRYLKFKGKDVQAPFGSPNRYKWDIDAEEVGGALAMPD